MTEAGVKDAGPRTDEQFAEALAEGIRIEPDPEAGETFSTHAVMTGGTRIDEVSAERDVILRDKIVNYSLSEKTRGREPAPLTMSRELVEAARHAFIPPSGFGEMSIRHHILIIRVGRGRGGGTAATRLLLDSGVGTVKELAPDVALRRLTAERLEPRVGYLLRNAAASVIDELTEFEIARLCESLGERDSRLVLTVDPRVRFPESLLDRYAADVGEPPAAGDVLSIHLRRRLQERDPDGRRVEEILEHPTVLEMLASSADRNDRVARAASFARIIADAEQAGDFDLAKIAEALKRITGASFDGWFDGLELGDRCFAIALATLTGYSYEIVSEAATRLEEELLPPVAPAPGEQRPDPFRIRRTERLATVLARVSSHPVLTRYGVTPMEVVTFIDPSLSRQILDRVWSEYPETRPKLLQWLRGLARHPVRDVRRGAANSVGVFAVQAFDYVRRFVIEPWAVSADAVDRQAAAMALISPAQDASVSHATRQMLWEWHLDRSAVQLRNTAVRAYGHLGHVDIDEALDAFAHLATENRYNLSQVIANSITLIIVNGDEQVGLETVRRLRLWAGSPDVDPPVGSIRAHRESTWQDDEADRRARMFVAFFAFLTAAADAKLVRPVDDRPDATAWYGLLWLAHRSADIAEVIADLWGEALVNPVSHEAASDVLTVWAISIETDSLGREAFARLVAAAVRHRRRARVTVTKLARSWSARSDADAPLAAAAVLAALTEPGISTESNGQ
ncbi:hypothetical protein [Dactylosporangium matsuzakiense]|uniref:Uncharacterized protein n=1 Tax=Dactylosporangium matsuzakiense TaxID=53360 RepID=A0A9W6KM95_9ACTN|nr:hypothetical protein [Dactylosporangium matsuzakiense]UWZ43148.1 hypothetical protein Dmats_37515 [Dactylosporangium matsuzakiense]GLL02765.1 hypothetical protein GCM10017581_045070 [Dactylosporangium matsuzakiense]